MLVIFNYLLMLPVALYCVYIIGLRKKENDRVRFFTQQERFMGNLVSEYGANENLMESLESSMRREDILFNKENNKMLDALSDGAHSENAAYFIRHSHNSYMSLLFALCATIRTYGDNVYEGVSLFARNLRYIKDELRSELLLSQERKYQFSGLDFLAPAPFFFTVVIENWSKGISAEMEEYYGGMYGLLTLILCFGATMICMWLISLMEFESQQGFASSFSARLMLKNDTVNRLLDAHIARHYSKYLRQNEELKKMSVYADIKLFLANRIAGGFIVSACVIPVAALIYMQGSVDIGVFFVLVLVMVALAFLLGYSLPSLKVTIYHYRNKNRMMEETLRFQTLILLLMHYADITVEEILSWMERFSDIFRDSIERAVDDFSYQRREAIERLKEELSYEPAVRLAESMAACDEISVEKAFYDLEGEREYYMEQYKQSAFDSLKERAAFSKLIAFFPFVLVLATRLIVPFVLVGLGELSMYSGMFG